MLIYRVAPLLAGVPVGSPGSATYLHRPQGRGRIDNPAFYDVWYASLTEAGAVGEVFFGMTTWGARMFEFGARMPGAQYKLLTFQIPDDSPLLDLDDPRTLYDRALRPSRVVTRNRASTQRWALDAWQDAGFGGRRWSGVQWWSRHHSEWPVLGYWNGAPNHVATADLSTSHPAVLDAAAVLNRLVVP